MMLSIDESGRCLGFFTPSQRLPNEPTIEELKALTDDPNAIWVTPEEVMARLASLNKAD
jgi:hypothetical protein